MKRRNPPDEKRRAIEGFLSGNIDQENTEPQEPEIVNVIPEEIGPDAIGLDDAPMPTASVDSFNWKPTAFIMVVIILFGLFAASLILARDQIFGFFGGLAGLGGGSSEKDETIAELRQEIGELKAKLEPNEIELVELKNLRAANIALQNELDSERTMVGQLEQDLADIRSGVTEGTANESGSEGAGISPELESAQAEITRLKGELEDASEEAAGLQERISQTNSRMISIANENSRLNEELEEAKTASAQLTVLKGDNVRLRERVNSLVRDLNAAKSEVQVLQSIADKSENTSDQLLQVNNEYRRVLQLLQESRDANNEKQKRIDELLEENGKLRQDVTNLERKVTRYENNEATADNNTTYSTSWNSTTSSGSGQQGVIDPVPIQIVRPAYPSSAIRRGVSGTVVVRALVSESGEVIDAEVVNSPDPYKSLDRAAIAAVKRWRFQPASRGGKAIRSWYSVPLDFTLKKD